MDNKKGVTSYKVYSNEVNFKWQFSVSKIAEALIDGASRHAENNGFGFRDLEKNNHAWVLARLCFEMKKYPTIDDTLIVETWVESFNKHFSSRNFCMKDASGEVIGYARSIWSVINYDTREAVNLLDYNKIGELIADYPCPIERQSRIEAPIDENPENYRIRLSDLDVNRHLTSGKYIDHLLDTIDETQFEEGYVSRFEIQYMSEVLYKENVILAKQEILPGNYLLELKNQEGNGACKCKVIFNKDI
ncbi:MAG: thioesterase [Bacteroidales bacterium]|nr:thioesterase [Bacteroidales bacterium]